MPYIQGSRDSSRTAGPATDVREPTPASKIKFESSIMTNEPRHFSLVIPPGDGAHEYLTVHVPRMIADRRASSPDFWDRVRLSLPTSVGATGIKFHIGLTGGGEWIQRLSHDDVPPGQSLVVLDNLFHGL